MPSINQRFHIPELSALGAAAATSSLNQAGDFFALLCEIPKSGNVTGIKFATGTVTTGCTVSGTIETLNSTTSVPTGSLYHANATGTVVVANTDDNVIKTVTFVSAAPVTIGDQVGICIRISSGTPSGLGLRGFDPIQQNSLPARYRVQSATATLSGTTASILLTYDTGDTVILGTSIFSNTSNLSLATNTTPDEVGSKFTCPFNLQSDGFMIRFGSDANVKAFDMVLYDSDNNVVATRSIPANAIVGMNTVLAYYGKWSSAVNLKKGRIYRLIAKPTTTTSWATMLIKYTGFAARPTTLTDISYAYTQRTDASSVWSDDTDAVVNIALSVSKIHQAGGSFM